MRTVVGVVSINQTHFLFLFSNNVRQYNTLLQFMAFCFSYHYWCLHDVFHKQRFFDFHFDTYLNFQLIISSNTMAKQAARKDSRTTCSSGASKLQLFDVSFLFLQPASMIGGKMAPAWSTDHGAPKVLHTWRKSSSTQVSSFAGTWNDFFLREGIFVLVPSVALNWFQLCSLRNEYNSEILLKLLYFQCSRLFCLVENFCMLCFDQMEKGDEVRTAPSSDEWRSRFWSGKQNFCFLFSLRPSTAILFV